MAVEVNFDGLVGPTHNYAGLSYGNVASTMNAKNVSNPRAAALQGLDKMRALLRLGIPQGIFPPHQRPLGSTLRSIGYWGSDTEMLEQAYRDDPGLVANLMSASAMWTANAATVSPSVDAEDQRVNFTPANLVSMGHRSFESVTTTRILRKIFADDRFFVVHDPLPAGPLFGDEGAANHNRLSPDHGSKGIEVFVSGKTALDPRLAPSRFPARQSLEASRAVARKHGLAEDRTIFVAQNIEAIDAGAFHNDVVCVSNEQVILFHELAFQNTSGFCEELIRVCDKADFEPIIVTASAKSFPIDDAIESYLFNSQLITLPSGEMSLLLPTNAEESSHAIEFADKCVAGDNPITSYRYLNVRQSMSNGGGPACLRLRVVLTNEEVEAVHPEVLLSHEKLDRLGDWVTTHYRDRLTPEDLVDPCFVKETHTALDELTQLLKLGTFYHFQANSLDFDVGIS